MSIVVDRNRVLLAGATAVRGSSRSARTVVPEYILADQRGDGLATVDVAAGDRTALAVAVLDDRDLQAGRPAARRRSVAVPAFHDPPPVVDALPPLVGLVLTIERSTSSYRFWPTSPIHRSPVARSNDQRHGLRSPRDQISLRPGSSDVRIGLRDLVLTSCRRVPLTSIRSILPSSESQALGAIARDRRRSRRRPYRCTGSRPARMPCGRRCDCCMGGRW